MSMASRRIMVRRRCLLRRWLRPVHTGRAASPSCCAISRASDAGDVTRARGPKLRIHPVRARSTQTFNAIETRPAGRSRTACVRCQVRLRT